MLFVKKPILVYQMGKCASVTVKENLEIFGRMKYEIIHFHRIYQMRLIADPKYLLKESLVISMTRELVGRNISWFFQNISSRAHFKSRYHIGSEEKVLSMSIYDLKHHFYCNVPINIHLESVNWFDNEFKKNLDFDVYDYDFNIEKGFEVYNSRFLIIRFEDMRRVGEKSIANFIGIDNFHFIENINDGFEKWYREKYIEFLKEPVPEWYINMMYDTKLMRHFYSKYEIDCFKKKYLNS